MRFNGWPELKEAFLSGYTDATFILAPLAMKLREEGVPVKIVYLGHRDGSAVMVHKDSPIYRTEDLRGKRVAIPNRFSNQRLLIYRSLKDKGMGFDDIELAHAREREDDHLSHRRAVFDHQRVETAFSRSAHAPTRCSIA